MSELANGNTYFGRDGHKKMLADQAAARAAFKETVIAGIKKAFVGVVGTAVVVGGLGWAASVGLDKMDTYDLENCESNPTTYACQEQYNTRLSNETIQFNIGIDKLRAGEVKSLKAEHDESLVQKTDDGASDEIGQIIRKYEQAPRMN